MANKEKISAIMDNELLDQSVIHSLVVNKQHSDVWHDYHLIGDVMRGDASTSCDWNIADKVAVALEGESAHFLEPQSSFSSSSVEPIIEQPTPSLVRQTLPRWVASLTQIGVAACVSLVVIFGVQEYHSVSIPAEVNSDMPLSVLQTIPFTGTAEPVSLGSAPTDNVSSTQDSQLMEQRRRINAMLQDYELQLRLNASDGRLIHVLSDQSLVTEP